MSFDPIHLNILFEPSWGGWWLKKSLLAGKKWSTGTL